MSDLPPIYEGLDEGIREVVELLRSAGFPTQESCEGGEGHLFRLPTVNIAISSLEEMDDIRERLVEFLLSNGYGGFNIMYLYSYNSDNEVFVTDGENGGMWSHVRLEFWGDKDLLAVKGNTPGITYEELMARIPPESQEHVRKVWEGE